MKQLLYAIAATCALTATLCGCKTSEDNYRAAYELARQNDRSGIDSTTYARIRNEAIPVSAVVDGDTLRMKAEYVRLTEGESADGARLMPRNIVVAQFKQIFNARSLRRRLLELGYTDALILETREPLYYVVAATASDNAAALQLRQQIAADSRIPMRAPFPWVLRPASLQ